VMVSPVLSFTRTWNILCMPQPSLSMSTCAWSSTGVDVILKLLVVVLVPLLWLGLWPIIVML